MEDLKELTVKELKAMCKELGGVKYSRMKEDELIAYIQELKADIEKFTEEVESDTVKFKKIIKGSFGFNGVEYKGSIIELSKKESENKRIKRAVELNILQPIK